MGDSDNSTPLSFVTSGKELARTANVKLQSHPTELARGDLEKDHTSDRAVTVWRHWQDAHKLTEQLCREQQRLERKLAEIIGFPSATILQSNGESVTLHSRKEIRELQRVGLIDEGIRAEAEADLAAHQARWDAADREIGYSAAMLAEHKAASRAEALLEELSETPAITLAGVAAKLDAVLREGQSSANDAEFPWPQIRSAIEDIARIGRQREPG
ncbi:hypothetical protein RFM68_12840 [Mesorhizobium sp. MSK_1335]|uniref:Uncharacterized protein n=1 Tax=Mesorhizobium montanum TaxID=3072323 RepID=A0ABU4ZJ50_9HYPH|nr:hypothetical protein [Mesorhizobium sp. MSK_1335]MDX8525398.1 hypothetical protein [Mesorhizobium sp. MSK_1335]